MKGYTNKGFTLLELLAILVIIGIMATIAAPKFELGFSRDRLRASTTSVTSALYTARMKAVNDGLPYGVQFYEDGTFQVMRDPGGAQEAEEGPRGNLEQGIEFDNIDFNDWLIVFSEFGQLEKTCLPTGYLSGAIVLNNGTETTTQIEVTYITGRIRETNI